FVNHGISIDTGEKAWHTGRERINSFRKPLAECEPNELWKGELDLELTQLDALTIQLQCVVKKLEELGKNDPRIVRLRTIPGIGPRTAEILVAFIDDPHRFENGRQAAAYFGLVPRQFQSGETDRNGRITKRGNPLARTRIAAEGSLLLTVRSNHSVAKHLEASRQAAARPQNEPSKQEMD
ncbi:MAG: transposase, partial [Pirellula sp.]